MYQEIWCTFNNSLKYLLNDQTVYRVQNNIVGGWALHVLEPSECRLPKLVNNGHFLQPLCSTVVLGPLMPINMHAEESRWWKLPIIPPPWSSVAQVLINALFPLSQNTCGGVSGAGLGLDWGALVCYSHVGGSGQMVVGVVDRNSKLPRQLLGWLSCSWKLKKIHSG